MRNMISFIMSISVGLMICLVPCITYSCYVTKHKYISSSPEWLPISIGSQERIVNDYVDALDEFAKVVPIIDDDTEAQWVADTAHIMLSAMKKESRSFTKDMATICHIHDYIAYGMTYFNAIIGCHKDPQLAGYALNIIPQSDSLFNGMKEVDFGDVRKLAFMQSTSAYNMQLFNTLNRINNDKDINREFYLSWYSYALVDSISQLKDYSDAEIFKISCAMESYSYFQMICPLLSLFAGSQEEYDSNLNILTEAATHFDSQATPIFQAVSRQKKIPVINDSEFEGWLVKAYRHKVELMRLLTALVNEWEKTEKN